MRAGQTQIAHTHRFLENLLKTIIARDTERLSRMVADFGVSYSQLVQASAEALEGKA